MSRTGDTDLQQKHVNGKGQYIVSSGVDNQGIIGRTDISARVFPANTITIDMFGNVYARDFDYKLVTHARVFSLEPLDAAMTWKPLLYVTATLQYLIKKFSYSDMASWNKVKGIEIVLPVDETGKIDFDFMEKSIRALEQERVRALEAYLKAAGFANCSLTKAERLAIAEIGCRTLRRFKISEIYDKVPFPKRAFDKRTDTSQTQSAEFSVPLVNAKHGDNGIMFYGRPEIFDSVDMTIDIVQNGAIATGDVYPQPQKTGVLWDAYLIKSMVYADTVETLCFVACTIEKTIKQRFSYEKKATWERVREAEIQLPVDENGEIDYKFMKAFIKGIMKKVISGVIAWKDREIKVTKSIVKA